MASYSPFWVTSERKHSGDALEQTHVVRITRPNHPMETQKSTR
jgi:hypothetical protein